MLAGLLTVAPGGPAMAQSQPVTFTKSFATNPIEAGAGQTMTFTITSTSADQIFEIEFTDDLANFLGGITPTGIDLPANGFCGFGSHASASDSTGILEVQGAFLEANGSCEFSVGFIVPTGLTPGDYTNTTSELNAATGVESFPVNAPAATATLTVDAADAPVFSKEFSPDTIAPGGISRLTFTIDNGANAIEAADLAFTDAFPAGLVVAGTPNGSTTCGGTFAPVAGGDTLAFAGGAVAAGDACAISVDVTSAVAGSYPNTSGALTSDLPDAAPPALATLTVDEAPLIVSMSFSPSTIAQGGVSRLSYDLRNDAAVGATSISLSDTLPADVVVADVPDARTTCGGVLTAAAGGDTLAFTGGAVAAAGGACAISVDVTSAVAGSYSNGPETVTSSLGASTPVQATLTVDAADAPVFSKEFSPDTIAPGGISRLTFTIDNGANAIEAADLAFTDAFPSGLVVADTPDVDNDCGGGTLTAAAGGDTLAFAGGAVAVGASCTISVDVTSAVAGSYPNTSGELTSDLPDAAPPALATLTVDEAPLIVSMSFSPSTIAQGGVSRLSYDLRNDAAVGATSISLSDTLPADVVVADVPDARTTCGGGTVTAAAGGDTIAFADGELAAGGACAISVDVTSAVAGSYSNGPESVTSSLGASTPVQATLTVDAADAPVFSKEFSPDTIAPGGISRLTFTIDNGANAIEAADLAFTDAFPAGLVVADTPNGSTTCGGTFAPGASDVSLAFTGGAVAVGASCTISVDVTSAVAGSYPNTSGALTSDLPDAAPAATATLTVDEAPLIVSMGFSPSTIAQGGVSRLSYDLGNAAAVGATSISLSDTLPADVVVADVPDARTTCGGGTVTAAAGGDTIAFADGELAAGGACAISVDVTSAVAGSYSNGPESVTSSLGASTPVQATLTVDAADAPVFSKEFSPDTIAPGGISRLTFTIDNGANAIEAADLAFTDAFPAGLVVADTPNGSTTCGGTFAPGASDVSLAFTGGAVAVGASCTISVDVTSAVAGSYPNTSGALTSDLPDAAPAATATLTVDEAPLIVSMGFSPSTIAQGGVSRLSYDLGNAAAVGATSISLSDTLPADVVVADVPDARTTCGGGTVTAAAGGDTIAFADGELAAGGACAISVDVTSAVAGSYSNGPESVTSSLGASTPVQATLTVDAADAPVFSKEFSPDTIAPGGISRLTFTIDNGANAIEAADLAFTDAFPAGLVVAGTPNGSTTCGGTFAPGASDVSLAFAGGAVAAGDACAISVDVTSAVAGSYPNTSGALTSDLPDAAPPALATLTVDEAPLIVSMSFSPSTIAQGGVSRLSYDLRNDAAVGATSISLSDTLPADVVVADVPDARTTCGGVLTAAAGGDTLAFTGGAVAAAGGACAISVDVTSAVAGSYSNGPEAVTSSLGASTPVQATLTVDAADAPVFSKEFSPDTIAPGGISRLTFTIDNGANAIEAADLAFTDAFPAGLVVADTPDVDNDCGGGTLTAAAGGDTLAFTGGAVAVGASCTISVDVTSAVAGSYPNTSGALTSDLPDAAPAATATLTVDEAPLIVSMGFSPSTIAQGGVSRLSYDLGNAAAVGATSISLSDTLPADVVVADVPDARTTCGGGTVTAAAGGDTIAFADGELAAGGACAISVDVTSAVAGSYSNGPESVTSSLGASTPVQATLTVDAADAPVFSKEFSPDTIAPGGISRLTFTIDNGANAIEAADLAFTDAFPAGLVVAGTPNGSTTCGGTFAPGASDVSLAFTGGAVAANAACEIRVTVRATGSAGPLTNTTSALESSLPDAPAATATLTVDADAPGFTKAFTPDTIDLGGISTLTFTIDNRANLIDVGSLAFNDNFPDGMIVAPDPDTQTTCTGGTISAAAGGASVGYSGGGVAAGASCTVSVDVQAVGLVGPLENISGALTSDLPDAPAATATLTVDEAPLIVSMGFSPSTIAQGGVSRLSYDLGNAAAVGATSISLSDTLPADVAVADVPDARTTCGGTVTAAAGGNQISYSGGAVAAGDACAISVDVTSAVAGSYPNGPETVTSSLGASTPVQATLTVTAADALVFTKAFSPDTIDPGGISTLTFTIDNGANAVEAADLAFTDAFPAGLVVAGTPNGSTTCGGTFAPGASDVSLAFAGGAVAAGDACAISVDVTSAVAGSYPNTSGALTSDLPDAAPPASATLTVDEAPLIVSMGFSPSTIAQGGISTLIYRLRNDAAVGATSISLSDTLPADVAVADAPNAATTCAGGVLTAPAGGDTIAFADGALGAGATCTLIVDVTSAVAGSYLNGPEAVTSSLGASTPVSATLTVDAADALVFSKAFSPSTIDPGGISRLTFTIDNGANAVEAADLAFTDAFPAGLVVAGTPNGSTTCGGTFAPAASDVSLAFAGGAVAVGASCTISVDVTSAVAGSYPNTSGALTSDLPDAAPPASATLTVDEAPLIVSMSFSPSTIAQGGVSRLSYELNNGAAVGATSISLSDTLPADVAVADVPDARTTCGGTLTVAAGGDTVVFTGGAVAAGGACAISVDVTSAVAGSYLNGPESVTSSLGASTPVQATLTVDAADAPVFSKAFSPDTIAPGGISRLTFTIDNGANGIEAAGLAFTDAFPSGLVVAGTPNGSTTCGGTFAPAASDVSLAFTGGAVAAGDACAISVDVTSAVAGSYPNTSGALTSDLPDAAPPASATLTVDEAPLIVSMEFSPSTIAQGGVSRLSYELNNDAAVGATSISLSDTLPADVVVADAPNAATTCAGGVLTAAAGGDTIAFADGALGAGGACAISVDVTSAVAGSYLNGPEAVTSSLGASTPVSATLTVDAADAPVFTKAFSPDTIAPGGISRLTFTIDNGANLIDVGSLAFTDAFPAGLVVADTPDVDNDCGGGTLTAAAGGDTLAFTGGAVAAGGACAISVDVTSAVAGSYPNTSGALTSDLPDAPAATATLTVDEAPLIVSMSFSPSTIAQGGVSRLGYGLRNDAAVGATSISLSDTLPADVTVADVPDARTTCGGGVLTAPAGGDTIAFADGAVAAGGACAISVDVTSAVAGSYSNGPEAVTSSLGDSTPVSATLTVDAADAPVFSKAFSPDTIDPGGISRLTFTIDNGANAVEAADLAFTDAFPAGLVVADTPDVDNDCGGGTLTAAAGGNTLAFAGGAVAANAACEIRVTVRATGSAGPLTNTTSALESSLPDAPAATATLTVNEAPLIVSMSFSPSTIAQGGVSRLSYELNNGAAVGATSISLSDTLPADVTVADVPDARTTCAGGVLTAPAGGDTIAFADGALGAGGACAISVDVTSAVAGSYSNGPEAVTSSLGDSTPVSATLTVDAADAPVFSKAFSPDTIDPGGISRLTFTIDNGANGIEAADLAFTDAFPAGLVVADTPDVDNDCGGGTLTAAAGGDTLAFAGGAVAANAACEIRVTVRATGSAGPLTNTTSALESSLPDAPPASATLTVNEAPLIVSMGFSPSTIAQGGVSRLSYDLGNAAAVGATSISLSDTLPADVVVADVPDARTTCGGGVLTATAGGDTLAFTGDAVAAGGACAISVDVTSAVAGSYLNGPESVTSSLGASTPASATLTVTAAVVPAFAGTVTFDVTSDTDGAFGFSSAEPGLTTSLEISGGTGSTGALPVATAGSHSVTVTAPAGVRLTAIACDDTDSTADMSAATVSVTVDASEDVTCTITARSPVEETVETINRFLTRRADLILSSEPDPSRRFDRLKRGSGNTGPISFSNDDLKALLPFTAQGGNGDYGFSTSLPQARRAIASAALALGPDGDIAYVENHRFDAWFEAQYKEFDAGADRRGDFGIAYAGVDYLLTPDVLVGALVSFDTMEETTDTGAVSGDGWMAGPYMTARLAPSLYFDGRLAAGESDNRISPFGVYTDEFPTGRWLSMASLTGEFQRGDWTIRPHASLSYLEERQKSYVDGVGATIPGRTVRLGQFKIGPAFTGRFEGAEGRFYSPYLKVDAIYNVGDTTGVTPAEANDAEVEGWRARVKAGVSMTTEHGTRLSLGATHDGLGRSDFETWGLTFELSVPIGKPKAR